jgi:hypothetical protein
MYRWHNAFWRAGNLARGGLGAVAGTATAPAMPRIAAAASGGGRVRRAPPWARARTMPASLGRTFWRCPRAEPRR